MMLQKEAFCKAIESLKEFYDHTERLKKELGVGELPQYEKFIDSYLRVLIDATNDKETEENGYQSWIVSYCWENDFGRSVRARVKPTYNGQGIKFSTPEDLYDILNGKYS